MKNSEPKKLDQILKDKLSEGTAQVPGFVWDRIEEELFPEKKRRVFFWWFFGGFCLLLIAVFIAMAVSGTQHTVPSEQPVLNRTKAPVSKAKELKENGPDWALDPFKTKGGSQYRELDNHRHAPGKSKVSGKDSRKTIKQNQKSSYSQSEQHTKYGSSARMKSAPAKKGKRDAVYSAGKNPGSQLHTASNSNLNNAGAPGISGPRATLQAKDEKQPASESENQIKTTGTGPKNNVSADKELSYAQILELVQRDFPKIPDDEKEQMPSSCVSIGIFGGPSLYHSAVFKDYFTSGQLSKRTFASSGFELGLQARVKLGNRFRVYAGLSFNQKQTQFKYNVAITEADYFTYIENGEKVPLENIHDDGMNSCFLAKDVTAKYQLQTVSVSIGTSFEFLRIGRFSAAADLRLSGNIRSSLKLQEMQVLSIVQPRAEKFSYLQPGAGLLLNFRLNRRISLGLAPFFSKQFYLKESFSRKLDELVIPLSVSFDL